jgi:cyclopropane fatty-acyl-phospholipid synthase-like methyltransferase
MGNLALGLARLGHHVVADELSALQRDFLRFRIARHGLQDLVEVLDPWSSPAAASFDAITAFDVLEHMSDGRETLRARLLPALRPGGAFFEDSPFVINAANPMHHADWGLTEALTAAGLSVAETHANLRVWR